MDVPIISSGGFGELNDLDDAIESGTDAVAIADAFHYERFSINDIVIIYLA